MGWIEYFLYITKEYWSDYRYLLLFLLTAVSIFVLEKDKIKKKFIIAFTIIVMVLIYNPLIIHASKVFIEESRFNQYFLRFFNIVPFIIIIAYGGTLILTKLNGVKKLLGVVVVCLVIALMGNNIFTEAWFTKAENRNKVPQDVITISDIFADNPEKVIKIMAPQDIAVYLRQIDSRFSMPYSRYIPDEAYELTNEHPDPSLVVKYSKENDVDYVVVSAVEDILNAYLNYGFTLYGRTTYYAVLQPNDPTWLLTEYEDASGDQGLAYTLKNINNGTFIVIDGGLFATHAE